MRSFAHLWQQDELSDVYIVLTGPHDSNSREDEACKLVSFPGHSVLLSDSPFFKAKILRWQNKRQEDEDVAAEADQAASADTQQRGGSKKRSSTARGQKQKKQKVAQQQQQHAKTANTSGPATNSSRRPQLVLTLEHADQQPAALVVLQALYGVKPLPELLSGLQQEQQLQAALLADMWQMPDVGAAAATILIAAADGDLSEAVTQQLMSMPAWPECLHAVAKQVLLSQLGDLEAVWADAALRKQLLGLPLHAMELLLSCDELKVASEDTVLYTIWRYVGPNCDALALEQLTPLIRCPQLSLYWLAAFASSTHVELEALSKLLPKLSTLLTARISMTDFQVTAEYMQGLLAGAPASWGLPRRALQPVSSVQVTWQLNVDDIRKSAQRSANANKPVSKSSPTSTPPIGGISFKIKLECSPKDDGSCQAGLFVVPSDLPGDLCASLEFQLQVQGTEHDDCMVPYVYSHDNYWGWSDYFGLSGIAGGWDEVAWAAKGFPTSGALPITVTVFGLSPNHAAPAGPISSAPVLGFR